ncbi:hypothetical protein AMECASPLE_024530 [Ameca splendens]|uniref:Uncharacterized protein n=1 Tax=Ameca splendens TaxID=208324 RepID=A0ABV0YFT1_9TELE
MLANSRAKYPRIMRLPPPCFTVSTRFSPSSFPVYVWTGCQKTVKYTAIEIPFAHADSCLMCRKTQKGSNFADRKAGRRTVKSLDGGDGEGESFILNFRLNSIYSV